MTETYTANVRIKDLPRWVDLILNRVATDKQLNKVDIVREALTEYAERHREE